MTQTSGVSAIALTAPWRVGHPLAEVGAQRQHRPTDRAHLAGQRVGVDDVRVGGLSHAWPSRLPGDRQRDVRERRVDGGIRLVDRDPRPFNTVVREADVRDALGQGLDQVDRIFLHGGFHRGHETSVVDGVAQVVRGRRGAGVDARARGRSRRAGPRAARSRRRRGARSTRCRSRPARRSSSARRGRGRSPGAESVGHDAQRVAVARTSCTRIAQTPCRARCTTRAACGGLPLVDGARGAVRRRPAARRGRTCGWPRPARGKPSSASRSRPAQQLPVVLGASWRSPAPGRARSGRASMPAAEHRVHPRRQLVADRRDDAARPVVRREVAHAGRCGRASAWRRTSRRWRRPRRASRGRPGRRRRR